MKRKNYKGRIIMINLVIKDFLLQKKYFLIFLVYGAVIAVSAGRVPEILASFLYVFYLVTATYLSTMYANGFEKRGKSETMLASLPVKREYVVVSKYLFLVSLIPVYSMVIWIFSTIVRLVDSKSISIFNFNAMIIAFVILGIAFSVYYPLYFKLGQDKLKIVTMFFYLLIFISPKISEKIYINLSRYNLLLFARDNIFLMATIGILITILLLTLSLNISSKIYNKKEL